MPKSGKVRSVPTALDVGRHLAGLAERDDWTDEDDLVFAEDDGAWLNDDELRLRYRAAQRASGLRRLRFHDLPHVFGSLAITRADIVEVQAWMGHADIQTTMRYCITVTAAKLRPASPTPSAPTRGRSPQVLCRMPPPEIGRPLPRAADAYTARTKWDLWILHDDHHGPDWRSSFGEVTFDQAWPTLAHAVLTAGVVNSRNTARFGATCAVDVVITLNGRARTVRSVWHYKSPEAAPRLVTAYPRT